MFSFVAGARSLALLVLGTVLAPVLLFCAYAWHNRADLYAAAEERAMRSAGVLHEHALKTFETQALLLQMTERRLRGLRNDEIFASRELWDEINLWERESEQADSVFYVDGNGQSVFTTRAFPPPADVNFSDRDYFQAHLAADAGLFVGKAYGAGKISRRPIVNLSIRKPSPDGRFAGVIGVSLLVNYYERFYETVGSPSDNYAVALIREDGETLVRYPTPTTNPPPPIAAFTEIVGAGQRSGIAKSNIDGLPRLYAFQKIRHFPVYVMYAIDESAISKTWHTNLRTAGAVTAAVTALLLLLGLVALRHRRREAEAMQRWSDEIAKRQKAETVSVEAAKMEALGKLTGGVAHDFNNLLAALLGQVEMAAKRVTDPQVRRFLDAAQRTIERGEKLTAQLLAFARRQPLAYTVFDPNAIIRAMSELLKNTIGGSRTLELRLDPNVWPVEADRNQFELAVLNLAVNARDATPQGGTIAIETVNVECGDCPEGLEGDFVAIAVRDTGTGMTPETLERAFEPLFTTKGVGKGTGLGLSIVYGFAKQSGGGAAISSHFGQGTTVTLYLRKGTQVQPYDSAPEAESPSVQVVPLRRS